ncbi:MAG: molybdate ABC transporter substrate-binding protein [Dehalococcoidia bacterium]
MRVRRLLPALFLTAAVLVMACSSNNNKTSTVAPATTVPPAATVAAVTTPALATPTRAVTSAPATPAPTPIRISSPTPAAASVSGSLIVFAAASLTDVFNQESDAFKKANPGVSIKFNDGASSALRTQLAQGAPADVFASADQANMDGARKDGSIDGADQLFVKNKLVVVYPKNSTKVQSIQDLAKPGVSFVLTDPSVPIGTYARQSLAKLAVDPAYGAGFDQKVLANLKSNEADVKAVVSKVQLGEADAAIVYATDAATAAKDVTTIVIPDQFNVIAAYPIALVKNAPNKAAGQAFISFVRSAAGQDLLKQAGFIVDSTTTLLKPAN